jgi:hypothetical protein
MGSNPHGARLCGVFPSLKPATKAPERARVDASRRSIIGTIRANPFEPSGFTP